LGSDGVTGRILAGKIALITGTSPNIGGVLASGLAAAGAGVACNDLDPAAAEGRAKQIEAEGGAALALPFDVTDAQSARLGVEEVLAKWGRIDILVNNAVKFDLAGLLEMPLERFRQQIDVILAGVFIMSQLVARSMIDRGIPGSMVNILSTAAWQGQAGNIGYSTGKSGLINFTRAAAMDLAPHRIRVNALTPTATIPDDPQLAAQTKELFAQAEEAGIVEFGRLNPWHRLPTPTDYVAPLVFLVSDQAALITGTNLTVDGGALAKYWPQIPKRS
jgi:NAD(P)-dependent dehydrogenase (short-subunit alcohol dehydrogenase family)